MRKILITLLALLLALLSCGALAEETGWFDEGAVEETAEAAWYELSGNDKVLTVRLSGNTKSGLSWFGEISDSSALELITQEVVQGESEGMAGTPTTHVASFRSPEGAENTATLIFRCAEEKSAAAVYTRVLEIATKADGTIRVLSVLESEPYADWLESGDGGCILTARVPGAGWNHDITDPEIIELITCEDLGDSYVASFMATMKAAGSAEIAFRNDNGSSYRSVVAFVNESGMISVERVEKFEVLEEPELVRCDVCLGWFEPGNIFRNHICISTSEDPEPVYFQTVNITAKSLNMRADAGTGYDVVAKLSKGDNPKFLGQHRWDEGGEEWYMVSAGGKTGWISAKYATMGGKGYVKIVGGNCNMRSQPDLDSSVVTVVNEGAVITYLGEGCTDTRGTDWYYVSSGSEKGWISSKYSRFVASPVQTDSKKNEYKYVKISGGSCNMRKSASLSADTVTTLKEGTYAEYLGEKASDDRGVEWYKVSYNKKTGWVSSKYAKLAKTKPTATPKPKTTPKPGSDEPDDMRLVYNPNRYEVLKVTDIYSQNGRDYFVTGCFGTLNKKGQPEKFDDRKSVTMALTPGAEVMLPADPFNGTELEYIDSPEVWFMEARNYAGSYSFYATFSMNESGELRSLVYRWLE